MAMNEQQIGLVVAAQNGDVKSFEQLYTIYYDKVYGFARMILKNETDAEDVLQEAFVTAWRKLNTLETPATFSVWIQIIAKNLCNMQLRRKNIAILLDAEQDIADFDTEESEEMLPAVYAEREDLRERLGSIIDNLSDVQRQTVTLYYFNELSVDEIAEIMECSSGTVKSRLFLARNTIKTEVEEQERKNGQKFYGVAGLPMLPLGKLIQSHMESMSISQSAAAASLSAVTESIINAGGTGVSSAGAAKGTAAAAKKMSLAAKIVLGITSTTVVGIVAVLVVIFASGGHNMNPPGNSDPVPGVSSAISSETTSELSVSSEPGDMSESADNSQPTAPGSTSSGDVVYDYNDLSTAIRDIPGKKALDEIYILLEGYWITQDNPFVAFHKNENGDHEIEYGLFQTSAGVRGKIIGGNATGKYEATLTVFIPAVPANEMNAAKPERTETIHIDIGGLYQSGSTIKVKIENPDINGWHTYKSGGSTLEQAFDNWFE